MAWWAWLLDGFCAGTFLVGTTAILAARSRR